MTSTHHAIDYIEINVHDLTVAREFYSRAFGWQFTAYGPSYAGIQAPDGQGEVGGLNAEGTPGPGGPLVLLYSEDLGSTLAAVEAAGGRVLQPPYAFPGGHRFQFADPSGNQLGVWSPSS
ncbi:VOC family protein [Ornithinimicrobium ciconiae]|uniref:VOC family protein n=1 Tax=Ornithinimicrobium ciconiae TaxID=2594265 RepID=A0A516GDN1_9MICO|nr:VOC family protein [Ornithinimicrobium ciconiae]QDO89636.1 VOC family protein [Ornithinimicrobium ciconiae]